MSNGSIKPSVGGTSKASGSAIRQVSGNVRGHNPSVVKSAESPDGEKLSTIRPGNLTETTKEKTNSKNDNDRGEVSRAEQNDARTFTNTRESGNQNIVNRVWGKTGALSGLQSNNITGTNGNGGSFGGSSGTLGIGSPGAGSIGASGGAAAIPSSSSPSLGSGGGSYGGGSSGGATPSQTTNSRQFIDDDGNVTNIDNGGNVIDRGNQPNDDAIRENPEKFNHDEGGKDPYEQNQRIEPDKKPTGTGEKIENTLSKMSEADKKIYDQLDKIVKVYRNDSVGFDSSLMNADTSREAAPDKREQALAVLVDSIKKESPEVQEKIISNLADWGKDDSKGAMQVFLSDKLSFGMNKSVGGFVVSGDGIGSKMALPLDLSDYTHTDIARHEGVHWKDVASDGELDGLVAGENKEIQDLMLSAMTKFEAGEYNKEDIEKLDIGNLRYGSGYNRKFNNEGEGKKLNPDDIMGSNKTLALAEARAVLEQEFADKPEEFRAVGGEFAKLADHWDDNVAKYDPKDSKNNESNVVKDGKEDGTAMA